MSVCLSGRERHGRGGSRWFGGGKRINRSQGITEGPTTDYVTSEQPLEELTEVGRAIVWMLVMKLIEAHQRQ